MLNYPYPADRRDNNQELALLKAKLKRDSQVSDKGSTRLHDVFIDRFIFIDIGLFI